MKKFMLLSTVLLILAGCGIKRNESVPTEDSSDRHTLRYEFIGELPKYRDGAYGSKPCKLYLMTDVTVDSLQGIKVRRRYVTVCTERFDYNIVTLSEYDTKIR